MNFNTIDYFFFLGIVLAAFYVCPRRLRYLVVLGAGYWFYYTWTPQYIWLLAAATLVAWGAGLLMERLSGADHGAGGLAKGANGILNARVILVIALLLELGLLCYFKYWTFLTGILRRFTGNSAAASGDPVTTLIIPLGLSFFIFKIVSYLVDVYRGKCSGERNPLLFAAYVSFFPQMSAGPIDRADSLLVQMKTMGDRAWINLDQIASGLTQLLLGYFMKLVIADRAAIFVNTVYASYESYGTWELVIAALLYALQIYCDFAGYSAMSIGIARMLGIEVAENFKAPYFAASVQEFWRRWHISLSGWLRDYVYIPLGGSRKGKMRKYLNLMITMAVSGLWHGAGWAFIAWGCLHGLYQVAAQILRDPLDRLWKKIGAKTESTGWKVGCILLTDAAVTFAWILFRTASLHVTVDMVKRMVQFYDPWVLFDGSLLTLGLGAAEWNILLFCLLVLFIIDYCSYKADLRFDRLLAGQPCLLRWAVIIGLFTATWVWGMYGPEFNAGAFIYMQF